MTTQPDLELRQHLNDEARMRLTRIFRMLHHLAIHDPLKSDASRLSDIRQFLSSALAKLEPSNGSIDPNPGSPEGDRPDLPGPRHV